MKNSDEKIYETYLERVDVSKVLARVVGLGAEEHDSQQIAVAAVDLGLVHVEDGLHALLKVRHRLHFVGRAVV